MLRVLFLWLLNRGRGDDYQARRQSSATDIVMDSLHLGLGAIGRILGVDGVMLGQTGVFPNRTLLLCPLHSFYLRCECWSAS